MNSRTALKNCNHTSRRFALGFAIVYIFIAPATAVSETGAVENDSPPSAAGYTYLLENGILYRGMALVRDPVPMDGPVLGMNVCENNLYYIRSGGNGIIDDATVYAGCIPPDGAPRFEYPLSIDISRYKIVKLEAANGALFILTSPVDGESQPGTLYRVQMNSGNVAEHAGVRDFTLAGIMPVLIQNDDNGIFCAVNGRALPCTVRGKISIRGIIDERILFVSNGTESEVIDIQAMKSLYIYSREAVFATPGDFNITVSAIDSVTDAASDAIVYYKAFVDGAETGRTETGPALKRLQFKTAVDPNDYHSIALERWELSRTRGKYERANNIRQPAPVRLFVPRGVVLQIDIEFDGTVYSTSTSILRKE